MPKVKYMHNVLTKDAQAVQSILSWPMFCKAHVLFNTQQCHHLVDYQFIILVGLRMRAKPADKMIGKYKLLVKEIKLIIDKCDKHIISECLKFNEVKAVLIKAAGLHRQVKDFQGKGDLKSEAGDSVKKGKK